MVTVKVVPGANERGACSGFLRLFRCVPILGLTSAATIPIVRRRMSSRRRYILLVALVAYVRLKIESGLLVFNVPAGDSMVGEWIRGGGRAVPIHMIRMRLISVLRS